MSLPIHRWFRFSAGFSAGWCETVIRNTGAKAVLDPFAGSGTTLLAAQAAGARSIGIEAQPFLARICAAKLSWSQAPDDLLDKGLRALANARQLDFSPPPPVDLIARIYPPEAYCQLASLKKSVDETDVELLWLVLVSILRECSPAGTAQWQYVLPNRTKSRVVNPFEAFERKLYRVCADIQELQGKISRPAKARVHAGDARDKDVFPEGWADLVLTSPPYANNYDYADATRLEMSFIGEADDWASLKSVRQGLVRSASQQMGGYDAEAELDDNPLLDVIGDDLRLVYNELANVRLTKPGRKAYHAMIVAYFADLALVWRNLRRAVRPGGRCCWVIGDSAPYGVHVPVEEWLGRIALASGFKTFNFEHVRHRNVKWENRKHRVPLHEGYLWVEG